MPKRIAIVIWWIGALLIASSAIGGVLGLASEIFDTHIENNKFKQCNTNKKIENSQYQEYLKHKEPESPKKPKEEIMFDDIQKWAEINKTEKCINPSFSFDCLYLVAAGLFIAVTCFSLSFILGGSFWKPPK